MRKREAKIGRSEKRTSEDEKKRCEKKKLKFKSSHLRPETDMVYLYSVCIITGNVVHGKVVKGWLIPLCRIG